MPLEDDIKLFRKAILSIDPLDFQYGLFAQFPQGCCEFTSCFLAKFLREECRLPTVMCRGENKHKQSLRHVWLRLGLIDIDITASQFSSTNKTVFVEESSRWHERFTIFKIEKPDIFFRDFDVSERNELIADYKNIFERYKLLKLKQPG